MRSRKSFIVWSFIGVFVLGVFPFVIGQLLTPPGDIFYGNKVIAPADYSIYYSYITQGAQGHFFMYDAFTSEAHRATLFQPLWFVVGIGARILHLSAPVAFAIARYATIPIFLLALWLATGWIWKENERRRRLGYILSIVASGLGAVLTILGPRLANFPWTYPDVWVSEAYSVLTLWSSAHFLLVTSGIIFVLIATERSWQEKRWSWALWAGLAGLATLSIHPFHIITWTILWTLLTVWRWIVQKKFPWGYMGRWLSVIAIGSPALLLFGLQYFFDPLTIHRSIQNIDASAVPWAMAAGLGLPLIFGILGAKFWPHKDERWRWLVALAFAYCIAAYAPVLFQRRLTQGIMLPFIWLSTPMFEKIIFFHRQRSTQIFFGGVVALLLSTSWLFIGGFIIKDYFHDLRTPIRMSYIDPEHQQLATYIQTTNPHQPLLTSLIESNVLAGLTAHQVYVGYGVETWNFDQKLNNMDSFFTDMTENEQRQLLDDAQLCYILTSPRTRAKGGAFQPEQWPDLTKAWSSINLALYKTPYCR